MGGHGTEVEVRSTNQIKGIYSNKKKNNDKFGKTQKKLPDLMMGGYNEQFQKKPQGGPGGFASDSDEYLNAQQLPMIKGGGSIHAQNVTDAYILNNTNQASGAGVVMGPGSNMGKPGMKKNVHNSNFNQSKYISGNVSTHHNQSQSPASQTFFKENTKNKNNNSLIGKKGWPSLKKKGTNQNTNNNAMYVSPYSKNPNPK